MNNTIDTLTHDEWERYITTIIRPFFGKHVPAEDLRQEAWYALLQASQKYRPDKGTKFSTYARAYMYTYVQRYFHWFLKSHNFIVLDECGEAEYTSDRSPADVATDKDRVEMIYVQLSEDEVRLLEMRHVYDMTLQDIGKAEDVTGQMIKNRLEKIENKLERIARREDHCRSGV